MSTIDTHPNAVYFIVAHPPAPAPYDDPRPGVERTCQVDVFLSFTGHTRDAYVTPADLAAGRLDVRHLHPDHPLAHRIIRQTITYVGDNSVTARAKAVVDAVAASGIAGVHLTPISYRTGIDVRRVAYAYAGIDGPQLKYGRIVMTFVRSKED